MVVGIEGRIKGVYCWNGKVVETASKVNLGGFMKDHINSDVAVSNDFWSRY